MIFDLDNTIYRETDFLFRVYKEISNKATHHQPKLIFKFLKTTFSKDGRFQIFDKLKKKFTSEHFNIQECLSILRNYKCENCIDTYPWFNKFLSQMNSDYTIKIITNGEPQQQQNKIYSIKFNWPQELIEVVYASSIESKPSTLSFYRLNGVENFINPIYVGDSLVDKKFCSQLGIEFYNSTKLYS